MRVRHSILARSILAPVILTLGALGSLATVPAVAAMTSAVPATSAVAAGAIAPNAYTYHA